MIRTTSTWRCRCGANIKVVGETERNKPLATALAQCPKCGDQQVIYAGRIIAITVENEEAARSRKDE
jgi:hypothetical protein